MPPRPEPTPKPILGHSDLVRALRAATAAGMRVVRIEIEPAKIVIIAADASAPATQS